MHIKHNTRWSLLLLFLITSISSAFAQEKLTFRVVDFSYDAFDQTARNERFKKIDGSGSPYAIVKVCSENSDDDLRDYRFNFGNMNHIVEDHDGELWLYVQKNAKTVTISRSGYATLHHYDLNTTIESGKTYRMKLSAQAAKVYTQMVMFAITPPDSKAVVTITKEGGQNRELFGTADETGGIAKNLRYGTYAYEVIAENYHPSEGRFTLDNQLETHVEKVTLRSNGAKVILDTGTEAEIYVNGTKRGTGKWTGFLQAGSYAVECRQTNHRPSQQTISVEEGKDRTIQLTPPTPIIGTLSLNSRPLGANIKIDGKDYGTTPRNIHDLLIGHHSITVSKDGYATKKEECDIREGEMLSLEIALEKSAFPQATTADGDKTFTVGNVTFTMKPVAGGTFTMGATAEQGSDVSDFEKPAHQVTLSDYYIGETEVTQELWQAVMGNNPSAFKGSNHPVEYVSWKDCQKFIKKLNKITVQKFRLPTEAEWEYAARGGKNSKCYKYSGSNNIDDVAWHMVHYLNGFHAVKAKQPNELGIYDMSGNVWEWCNDWFGRYSSNVQTNPAGPTKGYCRVCRGGYNYNDARDFRVSDRDLSSPDIHRNNLGLRLALSE
ncbi:MAG: SUMF1/EgtB/PvdO family nonheme iron enzyme [Bacteroidaceae bacterium]|nr:SUMF1/EgtB/PvdO family nonheme iron enzyme [Bacteroidaceae bacterium]